MPEILQRRKQMLSLLKMNCLLLCEVVGSQGKRHALKRWRWCGGKKQCGIASQGLGMRVLARCLSVSDIRAGASAPPPHAQINSST